MAKRRPNIAARTVGALSQLHWGLSLLLIAPAYLLFRELAVLRIPRGAGLDQLGQQLAALAALAAGQVLQYLVPVALLVAAILSWSRRRRAARLVRVATDSQSRAPLLNLTWQEFEELAAELFRRRGYSCQLTAAGADGGVDIVLRKQGEIFLVQCKQWRASKVGVEVVRGLFGLIAAQGATGGFVVSAGDFTREARDFARGRNIELVHANDLLAVQERMLPTDPGLCPACSAPMLQRTVRKGPNKGRVFFGCSRYPACTGTARR